MPRIKGQGCRIGFRERHVAGVVHPSAPEWDEGCRAGAGLHGGGHAPAAFIDNHEEHQEHEEKVAIAA
jgi:hypothetical protein